MKTNVQIFSQQTMSSIEIAELANKRHSDVLEAIRKMESAWVKVNGRKFPLVEYLDAKGEKRPMFQLSKTECLYVATKFNDEARARLIIRWEELEKKDALHHKIPQTYAEALRQIADQAEEKERMQLQLDNKTQQLDESKEWFTIKRFAKLHKLNWRDLKWRALKAISREHGYEIKKIFDANYGEVNIYHVDVFNMYSQNN